MNTIHRCRPPASRVRPYLLVREAERYQAEVRHALELARTLCTPRGGAR